MTPTLVPRLEEAQTRARALAERLDNLSRTLGGRHLEFERVDEAPAGSPAHRSEQMALWTELAVLRGQVERLVHENNLLWSRASGGIGEQPPVRLAAEYQGVLDQAVDMLASEGRDAVLRLLEDVEPPIGPAARATLLHSLAQHAVETSMADVLFFGERAQAIRPELGTARLIRRAATVTGDIAARARAGDLILKHGGATFRHPFDVDQNWADAGNVRPFLDGVTATRSGLQYPPPIYRRVLMALYSSLPMHKAGYGYRSQALLRELARSGHDVRSYTRLGFPRDIARYARKEPVAGFPIEDEVDGVRYRRLQGPPQLGRWGSTLSGYLANYTDALKIALIRERGQIVHSASNFVNAVAAYRAAKDAGLPFVHEVRGFWELTGASRDGAPDVAWRAGEEAKLEAQAASRADRVLTLNRPMRDELVRRGVDEARIVIVPNGVDPEELSPTPPDAALAAKLGLRDAPTIGYVGSFASYEGLDDLVHAFRILKSRGVRFNGLLVGDGEMFETLAALIRQNDLSDEVTLTGRVEHDQVQRHYSLIDIAPFPRKALQVCELVPPIKPYEAMGIGKAVVVSGVNALTDMVEDGSTGVVHRKGDVESLAHCLELLVADADLRRRLGEQGRRWVLGSRTWRHSASVIGNVYDELAAEWAARRLLGTP